MTAPLCRYCGLPIPKTTRSAFFNTRAKSPGLYPEKPRSIEAAQALLGDVQILTHRWGRDNAGQYVATAYTWDGKSYVDPHFCKPKCAENLGRLLAEESHCTKAYNNAKARQLLKERERNA